LLAGDLLNGRHRLALVSACDDGDSIRIVYLFMAPTPEVQRELWLTLDKSDLRFPSLASISYPASRFEREMHDLFGVIPLDHPLPRRLVRHSSWPQGWYPMRKDSGDAPPFGIDPEPFPFLKVKGEGVYEIPVGPIHAGIIEPGHFRFSVVGETILKLKVRLWFLHKGIERLFEGLGPRDGIALSERISGDSSLSHGLAYSLAVEDALQMELPTWVQGMRAMLLEMERLYNHIGDIGALCNDAGFGIINSHALVLREQLLRMNEKITGHRLLRGAVYPGGIRLLSLPGIEELRKLAKEVEELAGLALSNTVVKDRFTSTSVLAKNHAWEIGCLGPVARASGISNDARVEHPFFLLNYTPTIINGGDVLARFTERVEEFKSSVEIIEMICNLHSEGLEYNSDLQPPTHRSATFPISGVGVVESWRGAITTRIELNDDLTLSRVKIVDPSWFNWPALPVALESTIVPDFPLTNKSFSLSYSGNDL
jgi:Ni,Fe-hydrogenase III large subunit